MPEITVQSPLGPLRLAEAQGSITRLDWRAAARSQETPLLREARRQLAAYFAGKLRAFDLPLTLHGSPFQQSVWRAMQRIPYGMTRSYGELAHETDSAPRPGRGPCRCSKRTPLPRHDKRSPGGYG